MISLFRPKQDCRMCARGTKSQCPACEVPLCSRCLCACAYKYVTVRGTAHVLEDPWAEVAETPCGLALTPGHFTGQRVPPPDTQAARCPRCFAPAQDGPGWGTARYSLLVAGDPRELERQIDSEIQTTAFHREQSILDQVVAYNEHRPTPAHLHADDAQVMIRYTHHRYHQLESHVRELQHRLAAAEIRAERERGEARAQAILAAQATRDDLAAVVAARDGELRALTAYERVLDPSLEAHGCPTCGPLDLPQQRPAPLAPGRKAAPRRQRRQALGA